MNDVLTKIVNATRLALAEEPRSTIEWEREARAVRLDRKANRFRDAIRSSGDARIIAEIKAASPSAGSIVENPDVESIARSYAAGGAAALSVVTEPDFFRGSREWLRRSTDATGLPVVMKDFIVEPLQIERGIAAGADAVLLLASLLNARTMREFLSRIHQHGCDALVEVHDERELDVAIEAGAEIIGVNNRDLRDFSVSLETSERLSLLIPREAVRVSESGIRSAADVERLLAAGFDALLVGESLLRQHDRTAAVRALARSTSEAT